MESIRDALRVDGFSWLTMPIHDTEFVALAEMLGGVVDDTPIRVVPGKRTYLEIAGDEVHVLAGPRSTN